MAIANKKEIVKVNCYEVLIPPNFTTITFNDGKEVGKIISLDEGVYFVDKNNHEYYFVDEMVYVVIK